MRWCLAIFNLCRVRPGSQFCKISKSMLSQWHEGRTIRKLGPSLRDFSSWSPVSCVLVTFCKRICYWAWSQWLRHWSATIWDWTKDTQSFSASSGAISYPSVRRAGRIEAWERVAISPRVARPLILLFECRIVEFYPTPYPPHVVLNEVQVSRLKEM